MQNAAMKLVEAERNGEAFDPQLVIGVRQSYVSLNLDANDTLAVYKANFEKAYIDATEKFYKSRASQILESNGVQNYMTYADAKLSEEEARGRRYLDSNADSLQRVGFFCPLLFQSKWNLLIRLFICSFILFICSIYLFIRSDDGVLRG
ncbi:unnamed protein product [Anisakis simplex]|uniref:Cullin N-terminal domain-containing protein n=1 Tax=Anisakis simplex TaxID=6269 RepID=A0A3P6PXL3_ANISI|nr:unnamed protein product [Anisakis simplex]